MVPMLGFLWSSKANSQVAEVDGGARSRYGDRSRCSGGPEAY